MNINEVETFSRVRITTSEEVYEGVLLPKDGEIIVLKLDSGYNLGIQLSSLKDVEVLESKKSSKSPAPLEYDNKDLPKVKLIHTGGTIASRIDYETGGVVGKFTPEELLSLFPEIQQIGCVDAALLENMQSDDFRFSHFNEVARQILDGAKEGTQRFLVTTGTDFLHYMAAALSFLLKDVPVGVLVVGSQRSSDRGSSDAFINLICATQFLVESNFMGVGICTHVGTDDDSCHIISGLNARKMHSSARGTFKSINDTPIATVHYPDLTMDLHKTINLCQGEVPESIPLLDEHLKIGMIYSRPHMYAQEFSLYKDYDALLLVASGMGHFPINDSINPEHKGIREAIKELAKKIPVGMSTQTIYGRVNSQYLFTTTTSQSIRGFRPSVKYDY